MNYVRKHVPEFHPDRRRSENTGAQQKDQRMKRNNDVISWRQSEGHAASGFSIWSLNGRRSPQRWSPRVKVFCETGLSPQYWHEEPVSEHRTVTHHVLRSVREKLHQPVARVGEHCRHTDTHTSLRRCFLTGSLSDHVMVFTHVSRLQPQAEGAAVVLASLDGKNMNSRRTVSHHEPTQHLHSLQHTTRIYIESVTHIYIYIYIV